MKKFLGLFLALFIFALSSHAFSTDEVDVSVKYKDGKTETSVRKLVPLDGYSLLKLKKEELAKASSVEIAPRFARAKAGDDGYIVLSDGSIAKFRERADTRFDRRVIVMPLCGMRKNGRAFSAIIDGMRYDYKEVVKVEKNAYSLSLLFSFDRYQPYRDVDVEFRFLSGDDADYCGIARTYRNKRLALKEVEPLRARAAKRPVLARLAGSPEIRLRLGWKPAPSPVSNQTLDNEPEMKSKITFARAAEFAEAIKSAGVKSAEICLVGWNIKGHDGRYPQIFPVEESLGGESQLVELIKRAKSCGYMIVPHTNPNPAYPVSELWNESYVAKMPDGSLSLRPFKQPFSGGISYFICPKCQFELFAKSDFPRLRALGFDGANYIDALGCVPPIVCFDPRHPLNADESAAVSNATLRLSTAIFGATQSESGFMHVAESLDYVLYSVIGKVPEFADARVPLWEFVYHGIIMGNRSPQTVNYPAKDADARLAAAEVAVRPAMYVNSAFFERGKKRNWMGDSDFTFDTPRDFDAAVAGAKLMYSDAKLFEPLQYEFIEHHSEIAPRVFLTVFSDGSRIYTNYSESPFKGFGTEVAAKDFKVVRAEKNPTKLDKRRGGRYRFR